MSITEAYYDLLSEMASLEWMEDPSNQQTPEDIAIVRERVAAMTAAYETSENKSPPSP